MTKPERDELLSMLKQMSELANFSSGRRSDVPWQTVLDADFIRVRAMLKKFGVEVEYKYPPQELLDRRNPEWGKHPLCD